MKGIVWLASYPKSGNTWVRALLRALQGQGVDINRLTGAEHAADCARFDDALAIDPGLLLADEAAALRPRLHERLAAESPADPFLKIHDALLPTPAGEPLVAPAVTRAAVYIVRNPLDVAVSYAHHYGVTPAQAVAAMADPGHRIGVGLAGGGLQFPQRLADWSGHVTSWLSAPFPVLLLRYEDLERAPVREVTRLARPLGLETRPGRVRRAVGLARFDRLREQEEALGFREAPRGRRFFRSGASGSWRTGLAPELVARVLEDHGTVMKSLGYLDEAGRVPRRLGPVSGRD
ncbi:MAG: sulfotransferase domain-containing protein [Vicinamibacteria bacterium]|nr:sulfotransferase domain-containing protein [Vicinamibacteria bacterium]